MKWHFSPQLADQVENEITQRDQFNNDEVNISETIVREAVQNSLDASIAENSQTKVSFRWVDKSSGLDPVFFKSLFKNQILHAEAAELDVNVLDFENPNALVIEDFGTIGLTGSVSEKDENHFSDFWRRHGKSHKTGKSRGRWGLGKLVYSTTSEIGAFFGLTVRKDSPKCYLMGQTVLNLRTVEGTQYPPHAFFSDLENKNDVYKQIPVPIKSEDLVSEFTKNFSIVRKGEPGLSIIIPFPDRKFDLRSMIKVAIDNYYYPLITGQLELQFNDILITGQNVRSLAHEYESERSSQIDPLFDFIEEIYRAEQGQLLKMKPSWISNHVLDETDFDPETLAEIRARFKNGELVGLSLPVPIKLKNGENVDSYFSVYIKRPSDLKTGLDLYVRGGLTLPGEAKFKDRKALGAMIAEDEAICSFLGDAENPAHTQWTTNTEKLRKKYRNPQATVTAIKKSVVQLYDLLAEVTEEKDTDALQNFFWFDEPEEIKRKRKPKKPSPPQAVEKIEPQKKKIYITKQDGGFYITNTPHLSKNDLPKVINIEAAYEVTKGNAFKKYSPHDFKVGKNGNIHFSVLGEVKLISARENRWTFEIQDCDFKIEVAGFDKTRDLKVKVV